MKFITEPKFFGVVAVALFLWYLWNNPRFRPLFLGLVLTVGATDILSSRVIKNLVQRERPCRQLAVESRLPYGETSSTSFPSSHAANVFSAYGFLRCPFPQARLLMLTSALLVCYSRPYLGAHFPSDILAGALLGFMIGSLVFFLRHRRGEEFGGASPS